MNKPNLPNKGPGSKYLKDLKRTSLVQLGLFLLGVLGSLTNGEVQVRWIVNMGFGVVWTDSLILSALFGLVYLVTKSWAPKVSGWFGRTAISMIQWVPIAFVGYVLFFII